MPRIANPYGYNDPAMASIAGNIARMAFAGESPNEAALREATMREKAAAARARDAQANKFGSEAALNRQTVGARENNAVRKLVLELNGLDPNADFGALLQADTPEAERLRSDYRTYAPMAMYGTGTQKAGDVADAAFTNRQAGDLLLGDTAGVTLNAAAMQGDPTYDVKDDTIFHRFAGTEAPTTAGRLNASRDTRAPVKVVDPATGRTVYATPADALGMEVPQTPAKTDPIDEATDLLRLVELGLGVNEDNAGQFDPAAIQQVADDAWNLYQQTGNPTSAVTQAIQQNELTDYVEDDIPIWGFGQERPRTLKRGGEPAATPEQVAANPATAPVTVEPPAAAVQMLRKNPELAADFNAKYGEGAAARYLGR